MRRVRVYGTSICPFCVMARRLLDAKKVAYEDILLGGDPARREEMERLSGRRTVPQIFIGDVHVGGYDELAALERAGRLDSLLEAEGARGAG